MKKTLLCLLVLAILGTMGGIGLAWAQVIKEGPIQAPLIQPKKVFITSQTYSGNLGGLEGADQKCQQLANAAGLTGTFKAWLSDESGNSPAKRFFLIPPSYPYPQTIQRHPYVLVNGRTVAKDWADLTKGSIATPIRVDERGAYPTPSPPDLLPVWTSTTWQGNRTTRPQNDQCRGGGFCGYPTNWTLGQSPQPLECVPAQTTANCDCGSYGNGLVSMNLQWTQAGWNTCGAKFHLYCFQQ